MCPLLSLRPSQSATKEQQEIEAQKSNNKGFGAGQSSAKGKGNKQKGSGLSAADRGPLGKAPDVDAIRARGILHLPLGGRLKVAQVKAAYKKAAAEHHPDQGGEIIAMQKINAAKDFLLSIETNTN
jgi:hypothetical protein